MLDMSDMRSLLKGAACGAVVIVCALSATLSPTQALRTGQITGHVADTAGAIIQGASVFVRRTEPPEEEVRLLTHSDGHGDFKLTLAEVVYDVLVASRGFAS